MDKTNISLKIDVDVYERIRKQSEQEKRSIANMIRVLLERGLNQEEGK